ncbi:MAG: helix-turn-helix domain-containing protein [Candidatus Eisenbacteria bacterium]
MARGKKMATSRKGKAPVPRRKKTLHIRSAKQVRALRTPLRQAIVQTLTGPGAYTVRELADELGHEPAALYYHVHALEEAGIVVETDRRKGGGRPEGVYALVAERIIIDRTETSKAFLSALADLQRSTLRTAERELTRAVEARGDGGAREKASPMLLRLTPRLSPRATAHAVKMIHELAEFLAKNDDPEAGESYSLTAAFTRLVE